MKKTYTFNISKLDDNRYEIQYKSYVPRIVVINENLNERLEDQLQIHLKNYYKEVMSAQ